MAGWCVLFVACASVLLGYTGAAAIQPAPDDLPSCRECAAPGVACSLAYGALGEVRDPVGVPLAGARVEVVGLPAVLSDAEGRFEVTGARTDSCTLDYPVTVRVTADGFAPFTLDGYFPAIGLPLSFDVSLRDAVSPTPTCVPDACATPTPTPNGPVLHVEPATLPPIVCQGAFDLRISNIGPPDSNLVVEQVSFTYGYSQGDYGMDFSWDLSGVAFPVSLRPGDALAIPVSYQASSGLGAHRSRLHVGVASNAVAADPQDVGPFFGELCRTPTATPSNMPDLVPVRIALFAPTPIGGCLAQPGGAMIEKEICVRNRGDVASGPFAVFVHASSTPNDTFTMGGLAAGEQQCVRRPYSPFPGDELDVIVDSNNDVIEGDENNNGTFIIVAAPTPPPTCGSPTPTPTATASCTPGHDPAPGCAFEGPPRTATATPTGAVLRVEPASLPPIVCQGSFELHISNVGAPGSVLPIDTVSLGNGYSQGYYGHDFHWDVSGLTFPLSLAAGASISIPVTYEATNEPGYAFPSRLEVAVISSAISSFPIFRGVYFGELCTTPTPTATSPLGAASTPTMTETPMNPTVTLSPTPIGSFTPTPDESGDVTSPQASQPGSACSIDGRRRDQGWLGLFLLTVVGIALFCRRSVQPRAAAERFDNGGVAFGGVLHRPAPHPAPRIDH